MTFRPSQTHETFQRTTLQHFEIVLLDDGKEMACKMSNRAPCLKEHDA